MVIRLSAIDWLAIKRKVFPVGGNSAALAQVSQRERKTLGRRLIPPAPESSLNKLEKTSCAVFPKKRKGR